MAVYILCRSFPRSGVYVSCDLYVTWLRPRCVFQHPIAKFEYASDPVWMSRPSELELAPCQTPWLLRAGPPPSPDKWLVPQHSAHHPFAWQVWRRRAAPSSGFNKGFEDTRWDTQGGDGWLSPPLPDKLRLKEKKQMLIVPCLNHDTSTLWVNAICIP